MTQSKNRAGKKRTLLNRYTGQIPYRGFESLSAITFFVQYLQADDPDSSGDLV